MYYKIWQLKDGRLPNKNSHITFKIKLQNYSRAHSLLSFTFRILFSNLYLLTEPKLVLNCSWAHSLLIFTSNFLLFNFSNVTQAHPQLFSSSSFAKFELSNPTRATKVQTWHVWHTQTQHTTSEKGFEKDWWKSQKRPKMFKGLLYIFPGQRTLFKKKKILLLFSSKKMKRNFELLAFSLQQENLLLLKGK